MNERPELCELCEVNKVEFHYSNMYLCGNCKSEQELVVREIKAGMKESELNKRIENMGEYIKINQALQVREDIFNNESATLQEIVVMVGNDDRITEKNFRVCELVKEKIQGLKKLIFDESERLVELNNKLRVNEQFLQEKANKLRTEERDKLRLQDASYKAPNPKISKPKLISIKKKTDKELVKKCVNELNTEFPQMKITEVLFQMIMVQKGRGPEDTLYDLRRKFKETVSSLPSNE